MCSQCIAGVQLSSMCRAQLVNVHLTRTLSDGHVYAHLTRMLSWSTLDTYAIVAHTPDMFTHMSSMWLRLALHLRLYMCCLHACHFGSSMSAGVF